jgi:hypothetical protein
MVDILRLSALAACRAALRPLVRMLLAHGVMHKEFVALSKEIYVEVARQRYGIRGRPTNTARVALLTGLDRKEVARVKKTIEERGDSEREPARRQDRIARVLAGWFQDPAYLDATGRPLTLPLEGPAPSYESLVGRYGGDVPPVTILRELKRTNAVRVDDQGVAALRRNYRLDTADPDSVSRAGSVLADIGGTVTHNLYRDADEPSRFEARATNTQIPQSALPAYREMLTHEGQVFLEKVDAWLTRHEIDPATSGREAETATRLGVGVYWIQSMDGSV